jgi:flagellar L-ring protein precursor FlgH
MKLLISVLLIGSLTLAAKKKAAAPPQSPLDHFVTDARARSAAAPAATPGGIWAPGSRLADAARDLKASQIDDMITVLVVETASAVAKGTTSRDVVISTTLTARVSGVLPNGAMLVEATKDVEINSERQTITVRGIVRPADVASDNTVRSDRLGQLEVRVNGKGVVGDAIKRPFILYRLLLGLLPF